MADRRPAIDVQIPAAALPLIEHIDALVDDYRPFAVEETSNETLRGTVSEAGGRRFHFFMADDRTAAADAIIRRFGHAGVTVTSIDVVDDGAKWAALTQATLKAVRIDTVVVAPPWDVPTPGTDVTVVIEPSLGFGTGHHESTRLCLRALQTQPLEGQPVTDLGTGSGVLAITAARLGARPVIGIDSDADSIAAAQRNVDANHVTDVVSLRCDDLRSLRPSPAAAVVLANLTAPLLHAVAPTVAECTRTGGVMILSGLTTDRSPTDEVVAVCQSYAPFARLERQLVEGEWTALVFRAGAAH